MPRGKTAGKVPCKPARQLLFSEALRQQKHPATTDSPPPSHNTMSEATQGVSMDRKLQEISAVGRKLEGMDTAMLALTAETRSMRLEIAGLHKLIDLEDRSHRNNIRFLGFPEGIEGTDILSYLRDTLPKLADITFDALWNFKERIDLVSRDKTGKIVLAQS
ncbi:hypothetical protein NDU88_003932 [Pleurodeles waltl]|uniref:Uncharacterized protein n=1 Tax=Pleurodeles waltl TaxID=8319 RepID=A0AAV7UZU9_PLEWA|nr:hypothetical protein NDU88_003932 [Pleurodeles waltl]